MFTSPAWLWMSRSVVRGPSRTETERGVTQILKVVVVAFFFLGSGRKRSALCFLYGIEIRRAAGLLVRRFKGTKQAQKGLKKRPPYPFESHRAPALKEAAV